MAMEELSREEEMQAYTDTLGAIAIAISRQVDARQFSADLKQLADMAAKRGNGPSAGLLDEIARVIDSKVIGRKNH